MMSPNTFIASGVTLLSLAAGVALLYKFSKENTHVLYKIGAWFIVAASLLNMGFSGLNCMARFYHKHYMMHGMEMKEMHRPQGVCFHGGCCGKSEERMKGNCCGNSCMQRHCGGMQECESEHMSGKYRSESNDSCMKHTDKTADFRNK